MRLSIVGFGTVGRWLAVAIDRRRSWLAAECGVAVSLFGVATRRDGSTVAPTSSHPVKVRAPPRRWN
jgi:homoserine dehydrogenase